MSLRPSPALLLAAALLSCSAAEAPPPPSAPALASPPAASTVAPIAAASASAAPAVPEGVCTRLLAHNRELIGKSGLAESGESEEQISLSRACFVTPKGAWGLRLDSWARTGEDQSGPTEAKGSFTVVHLPEGVAATEAPANFQDLEAGFVTTSLQPPLLFDYDGDGEPELFQIAHTHVHEDAGRTVSAIYTWKNGAVRLYPGVPAGVVSSEDVDADGRPDLLYHPYSEVRESACSGFGFRWDGPALVAHSLPGGGFSLGDEATRGHLRRTCPPPARGKRKPLQGESCDHCPGQDCNFCPGMQHPPEVCARLHGASEKEALGLLKRACKAPKNAEQECQPPAGVCGDYKEREKVLAHVVPLAAPARPASPLAPRR